MSVFKYDLPNGDSYIGEVVTAGGGVVVMRNYAAWYEGDSAPYSSPYVDDEVSFRVDNKTRVTVAV